MGKKKTPEEEEEIFNQIDQVASNLSRQVEELQFFLNKLRPQGKTTEHIKLVPHEGQTDQQYG